MHHATRERLDAAIQILAAIQPATVRAVCYRLFTAGLIPDMSKSSTNRVSDLLARARERVREEITALVDRDAWDHCMAVEKVQRELMNGFLGAIRSTFDGGNSI